MGLPENGGEFDVPVHAYSRSCTRPIKGSRRHRCPPLSLYFVPSIHQQLRHHQAWRRRSSTKASRL